ncbi:Rdx family protein, partial [Salmonella sp. s54412]|uniref:Rdx family protein n=1 Tax=Salmonella sp. s54412 TaxID=3160128 RepID=UPI003753F322
GKTSSFEVWVHEILIFSKLASKGFPQFDEIVNIVKEVSEGGEPREATKKQPGGCVVS